MIYIDLLLIAAVVVFVVDLSGFTPNWKDALGRILHRDVDRVKPFDCSLCMTWWCCLIYAWCVGALSVGVVAYIALLAYMTWPIQQLLVLIREGVLKTIDKLISKL